MVSEIKNQESSKPQNVMTLEKFTLLSRENIAEVLFDPGEDQKGNIKRLVDQLTDPFNPFKPNTWNNSEIKTRRYQIIINPNLDGESQMLTFLRQINNVRIELENLNGTSETTIINTREDYERKKLHEEKNMEDFFRENSQLVKDIFESFK